MQAQQLFEAAKEQKDWIANIRRTLHRFPELMYEEVKTSQLVRDTLDELQIPYESGIAETGVLATLGTGDSPCVALRADMDALPIHEEADVDFRSEVDGKMHACGHDCHTSMLLGAAKLLKERESDLKGTVKLVFQPAEEGGAGGLRMRTHGILENPNVDRIFGLHVWPGLPTGQVGSREGAFLAAAGNFDVVIKGKGGHAAMPHLCIDPITTAAKVICELQTIVSREIDPLESGVVSVTTIHAGDANNVIPPSAKLTGTIRALSMERFQMLRERVQEIVTHISVANQCEATIEFADNAYPPTVNDGETWTMVQDIAGDLLGAEVVHEVPPVMGGEDFAFYTEQVPGCFLALGVGNPEVGSVYGLHHPQFKVDEEALPIGSALHAIFAFRALSA